jgi:hypothetical protein
MPEENRAEESTAAGHRTAQSRDRAGVSSSGPIEPPAEGVLTLVCLECGKEYYFSDEDPPEGMKCEKCGNGVFRDFFDPQSNTEAAEDFENSTARDLDPDDAEGDAMPGDALDLNRD